MTDKSSARAVVAVLAVASATVACSAPQVSPPRPSALVPPGDVILAHELATLPEASAYEAVERLRPRFLWSRPSPSDAERSSPTPCAIVDGGTPAEAHVLRRLAAPQVLEIKRVEHREASQRYGKSCSYGALLVKTRATVSGRI